MQKTLELRQSSSRQPELENGVSSRMIACPGDGDVATLWAVAEPRAGGVVAKTILARRMAHDMREMAETRARATLVRMAPREKIQSDLPDAADVSVRDGLHRGRGRVAFEKQPYRKPSEVGCVLAALNPGVGELSPEAYAAFLEEL